MSTIIGYVNNHGYTVEVDGEQVYAAGNHRSESTAHVEPGSPAALPYPTLVGYCRQTTADIAQERGVTEFAVEDVPNDETELDLYDRSKWRPASGHPGGWRVVRETATPSLEELNGRTGRRILFKSYEAAQRRDDALNKAASRIPQPAT